MSLVYFIRLKMTFVSGLHSQDRASGDSCLASLKLALYLVSQKPHYTTTYVCLKNVIFRCHFNTIYPSQYLNYLLISIKARQQHPVYLFTQGNDFQFSLFLFLVQGRASLRKSIKNQYIRY